VSILRNIGVIRNTGYELTVGTQWVRSDLVTWGTQFSVSHNRNVVVSLGRGVEPFTSPDGSRVAAGYPLGGRWERPILGYGDQNGDGIIETSEVLLGDTAVYLGTSEPDYTAGLQTTLSFFRGVLAVNAGLTYDDGFTQLNQAMMSSATWRGNNDPSASAAEQAAAVSVSTSTGGTGTRYALMQTVSALRFNSLSVAYNIPRGVARRVGARALTVAVQGTNLWLRTNYRGKDPNVNAFGTGNNVADSGVLPQPRMWQLRVSASY
jgi:hypothetical protein